MRQLDIAGNNLFGLVDELFRAPARAQRSTNEGIIRVDIKETPDNYLLIADLPGIAKENVKIKFDKGNLTVSVNKVEEIEKTEGQKLIFNERYATFKSRTFFLGDNVRDADIKASYTDGVLTLDVPKLQQTVSVREINIE